MAFVTKGAGSGYWLTMTVVDNGDDKSTLTYELTAIDAITADVAATAIIDAYNGVGMGVVSGYNVGLRYEENAFAYPVSGVENQNKARIVSQLVGNTKKATLDIPAPDPAIFVDVTGVNANIVDFTNAAVIAYLGTFQAAGQAFISDGEIMDFPIQGKRVSSRKGFRG